MRDTMKRVLACVVLAALIVGALPVLAQEGPKAVVDMSQTALREGPDPLYLEITRLERGTEVTIIGRSEDGSWILVQTEDGTQGWGFTRQYDIEEGGLNDVAVADVEPVEPIVSPKGAPVALRVGANAIFAEQGRMKNRSAVGEAVGRNKEGDWILVETEDGGMGWAFARTLDLPFNVMALPIEDSPVPPYGTVNISRTVLREGPDALYPEIGDVVRDTFVVLLGVSPDGKWIKVRTAESLEGWGFARQYKLSGDVGLLKEAAYDEIVPVASPKGAPVALRLGANSVFAEIGRMETRSVKAAVLGRNVDADWLFVGLEDGTQGWAFARTLELNDFNVLGLPVISSPEPPTGTTKLNTVLREGPDPVYPEVAEVARDTMVTVEGVGEGGAWIKVRTEDGISGWGFARQYDVYGPVELLREAAYDEIMPTVMPKGAPVALRVADNSAFAEAARIVRGEEAMAIARNADSNWIYVVTPQGEEGWAFARSLNFSEFNVSGLMVRPTPEQPTGVVKLSTVLREGPDPIYLEVAEIARDTKVMVEGAAKDGAWIKVRTEDGVSGWGFARQYELAGPIELLREAAYDEIMPVAEPNSSMVVLREGPATYFPKAGTIEADEVSVTGRDRSAEWVMVEAEGVSGWAYGATLEFGAFNVPGLTVIPADKDLTLEVTAGVSALREGPGLYFYRVEGLRRGDWVTLKARTSDSAYIRVETPEGMMGWMPSNAVNQDAVNILGLPIDREIVMPSLVATTKLPSALRYGPDAGFPEVVSFEEADVELTLEAMSENGRWFYVEGPEGEMGWVFEGRVEIDPNLNLDALPVKSVTDNATVTTNLNLRTGPSTSFTIVRVMPADARIIVLGEEAEAPEEGDRWLYGYDPAEGDVFWLWGEFVELDNADMELLPVE